MAGKWHAIGGRDEGIFRSETASGSPRFRVYFRDTAGRQTVETFKSITAARNFKSRIEVAAQDGNLPDVEKASRTVAEAWEYLVATWRRKPSTLAGYESRWRVHIEPVLGAKKVGSVRRSELEAFYTDVEARTSLDTRRKVQQLVHKVFAVVVRAEWIARNPADYIEMPQAVVVRQPRPLTDDEIWAVADEVEPRFRALVWTLAETGMRVGEALALRVGNVDGSIRVVENAVEVHGKRVVGTPKTPGSERVVPISPRLRAELKTHFDAGFANRFDLTSLLFTTNNGTPVRQGNFRRRVFQPAAANAKVAPIPTVHDLRHTAISLWLHRGLTPFEVSKMVGHADLKMIEQRYGHLYHQAFQEKIDRLGTTHGSA